MPTSTPPPAFPVKSALAIATGALLLSAWHWRFSDAGADWRSFAAVPRLPFLTHKPTAGGPTPRHEPEPDVQGSGSGQGGNHAGLPGDGAAHNPQQADDALLIDNAGSLDGF